MLLVKLSEGVCQRYNLPRETFLDVLFVEGTTHYVSFNGARLPVEESDIVEKKHFAETTHIREQKQILKG